MINFIVNLLAVIGLAVLLCAAVVIFVAYTNPDLFSAAVCDLQTSTDAGFTMCYWTR